MNIIQKPTLTSERVLVEHELQVYTTGDVIESA